MNGVALGVHVLDVLARPVERIPEGQGGELIEEIKITAAGSAGGAALTLAKLGAEVHSAGAVGTDATGDMLLQLLEQGGIDTSLLLRRDGVPTSATVLPIRPNGDRPALHVIGANGAYGADDVPRDAIAAGRLPALRRPRVHGRRGRGPVLEHARANGDGHLRRRAGPGRPGLLEWIAAALPHVDWFFPNDEQVLAFTGADDLEAGCRALVERGVGCVAATRGADGVLIVDAGRRRVRAGVRGRRGRHHRLRRLVRRRLPARALAGPQPPRCRRAGQRGRRAGGAGARQRRRRVRSRSRPTSSRRGSEPR